MQRLVLLLALCFVPGCSMKKIAFHNADWIAMYEADSYFDLTSKQESELRREVEPYIAWLKAEPFDQAIDELKTIHTAVADGLSEKEYADAQQNFQALRVKVLEKLAPIAGRMLPKLSKEQWDHLREELEESNEDLEELANASDRNFEKLSRKRLTKYEKFYEELLGDLTTAQRNLIRETARLTRADAKLALSARQESQNTFISTIQPLKSPEAIAAKIREWAANPEAMGPKSYAPWRNKRQKATRELVLNLDPTVSPAQREHFRKKLLEFVKDMEALRPKSPA